MRIKPIVNAVLKFGKRHSTKILAGCAIVSECVGFWLVHKRAPIVHEKLKALPPEATNWDRLKVAGPIYLPAAIMLVTSGACIIGGCAIGEARLAAMTNIAMATDAALARTEQKLIESVGEEKAQKMHEEIAKDVMKEHPLEPENIIATTHGVDIFFDPLSGRYFTSSRSFIESAQNYINEEINGDFTMWQSVNDWYSALDIGEVKLGGLAGWNYSHKLKIEFGDNIWHNGRPCIPIIYYEYPRLHNDRSTEAYM